PARHVTFPPQRFRTYGYRHHHRRSQSVHAALGHHGRSEAQSGYRIDGGHLRRKREGHTEKVGVLFTPPGPGKRKTRFRRLLKNANFQAPHWQKGFFDHVIRSQESFGSEVAVCPRKFCARWIGSVGGGLALCWSIMRLSVLKEIGAVTDRAYSFPAP